MPTMQETMQRIWSEPQLKAKLLTDPKAALKELGVEAPPGMTIKVFENTPQEMHFVLPSKATVPPGFDPDQLEPTIGKVLKKAWSDAAFKQRLLSDAKPAIAEASGVQLPSSISVRVHEDSATLKNMVIAVDPASEELSDADLEMVAGGAASKEDKAKFAGAGCAAGSGAVGIAGGALSFTLIGCIITGIAAGAGAITSAAVAGTLNN